MKCFVHQCWVGNNAMPEKESRWTESIAQAAHKSGYEYKLFTNEDWEKQADVGGGYGDEVLAAFLKAYRLYPANKICGAVSDWWRVKLMKESADAAVWWCDTDVGSNCMIPDPAWMNNIGDVLMFSEFRPWTHWGVIYKAGNTNSIPFWTRLYTRLQRYYLELFQDVEDKDDVVQAINKTHPFGEVCVPEVKASNDFRLVRMPVSICNYSPLQRRVHSVFSHYNRKAWRYKR